MTFKIYGESVKDKDKKRKKNSSVSHFDALTQKYKTQWFKESLINENKPQFPIITTVCNLKWFYYLEIFSHIIFLPSLQFLFSSVPLFSWMLMTMVVVGGVIWDHATLGFFFKRKLQDSCYVPNSQDLKMSLPIYWLECNRFPITQTIAGPC